MSDSSVPGWVEAIVAAMALLGGWTEWIRRGFNRSVTDLAVKQNTMNDTLIRIEERQKAMEERQNRSDGWPKH